MCIKSEFKQICLKLATNGRSDKGFLLTSKVCPQGVFCPCLGAIYMYKIIKNVYKIRFRRDHFETCNIWQSDKAFLLTSKVCPQGVVIPCPGAIYMYKIIKNVYKIRFRRDHFGTCNLWAKRKGLSVVIEILSPIYCLPLPGAIYMWKNMKKHLGIVLKLATNGQSDKGFLLTLTFVPKGLSALALGLYTCIKALKYVPGPGFRWAFTGPLVLWFRNYCRLWFETSNRWPKLQEVSVDIKTLSPGGCMPPARGYIHVKNHEKIV